MADEDVVLVRDDCVHGRDIDDLAVDLRLHLRHNVLADQENALDVRVEGLVPVLDRKSVDAAAHRDARVVEQNVDVAEFLQHGRDGLAHVRARRLHHGPRERVDALDVEAGRTEGVGEAEIRVETLEASGELGG